MVDDISYLDEPIFSAAPIGDAVEVTAQGVHYFSSAGNGGVAEGLQSPVRCSPPLRGPRARTSTSTASTPPVHGGLQDADPGPGIDMAQDLVSRADGGGTILDLQWDDPVDPDGPHVGRLDPSTTAEP